MKPHFHQGLIHVSEMPLASAGMAHCLHKTQVPALLNEDPPSHPMVDLQQDRDFSRSTRAGGGNGFHEAAATTASGKSCVVVVKQYSCKLGRCSAAATLVPLMQR